MLEDGAGGALGGDFFSRRFKLFSFSPTVGDDRK